MAGHALTALEFGDYRRGRRRYARLSVVARSGACLDRLAARDLLYSATELGLASCRIRSPDRCGIRLDFQHARVPGLSGEPGYPVPLGFPRVRTVYRLVRFHPLHGSRRRLETDVLVVGLYKSDHGGGIGGDGDRVVSAPPENLSADRQRARRRGAAARNRAPQLGVGAVQLLRGARFARLCAALPGSARSCRRTTVPS